MDEQAAEVREAQRDVDYTNAILRRLLEYYLARVTLPGKQETISVPRLHRLCRHVVAEGYGE